MARDTTHAVAPDSPYKDHDNRKRQFKEVSMASRVLTGLAKAVGTLLPSVVQQHQHL